MKKDEHDTGWRPPGFKLILFSKKSLFICMLVVFFFLRLESHVSQANKFGKGGHSTLDPPTSSFLQLEVQVCVNTHGFSVSSKKETLIQSNKIIFSWVWWHHYLGD